MARSVNAAAGVITRAMENGRQTPAGWAMALDAACMLQSPETAAELVRLRRESETNRVDGQRLIRAEQRTAELEAVLGTHRKDDQAEISRLKARIAELGQLLAGKDRPVDEDPIAFTLTDKATALTPPAPQKDVTRQVRKLRNLLAGQRAAVEDPHDGPLSHSYLVGRDMPETGGSR